MTSFLKEVIQDLIEKKRTISDLTFILPSKRAGTFLKNIIAQATTQTIFAPEIFSIEEFVEQISSLDYASNTEMLFEFYQVYKNETEENEQEPFDQFSKWAQLALQDFNEIDRYLIDPNHMFDYLKSIKEITHWSLATEPTNYIKNYLVFWNRLKTYYVKFAETLYLQKKGYQGLVYREATQAIDTYIKHNSKQEYVFIGFNALNKAEELIVQKLLEVGQAKIYWDIDSVFINNKFHDAGMFMRAHKTSWPYYKTNDFINISNNYRAYKNIHSIAVPKNIGQIKYIGELLDKLPNADLKGTAVILGDENLLIPLLNSIPKKIDTINITMGLPLKSVPLASLFDQLFKIQKTNSDELYYKDVIALLSHSFLQQSLDEDQRLAINNVISHIQDNNIVTLSLEKLVSLAPSEEILMRLVFQAWNNNPAVAFKAISELILSIRKTLDSEKTKNLLALEYLYRFNQIFNELQTYNTKYNSVITTNTLYQLYKELLSSETLDFQGEPLQGLQIMGMLESRVLDFETVIISSVNEGILPAGKSINSFIPFDVKIENGLPTYKEKDAVYTYHFYRLLQRAKNVYILYNTEPDVLNGGEKSRFLTQLQIENIHQIKHQIIAPKVEVAQKTLKIIQKNESVSTRLRQIASQGFSPSALTSYIRNPLDFYYQKILKIESFEDVEETVAANTLGSVIHHTLEDFYTPFIGVLLKVTDLENMKSKIEKSVTHHFQSYYKDGNMTKGKNLIILEIAKRYILNFIQKEITTVKDGHSIRILSLEKELKAPIDIPEINFPVFLRGTVDRIDEFDGTLRIIDYKTGKVASGQVEITDWEDITTDYTKFSKSFQILTYAYMMSKNQNITQPLEAGIISFKNLKGDYFLKFSKKEFGSKKKNSLIDTETLASFEIELRKLIVEICNPKIQFIEKEV